MEFLSTRFFGTFPILTPFTSYYLFSPFLIPRSIFSSIYPNSLDWSEDEISEKLSMSFSLLFDYEMHGWGY
jgi:hypothetical protein